MIPNHDYQLNWRHQNDLDDRVSESFGEDPGVEYQKLCHDCGEAKYLREYEKDDLAGTAVLHIEICQDCYEERTS